MLRRLAIAVLFSLLVQPLSSRQGHAAPAPGLLEWARRLVAGITPETNVYASRPTIVTW